MFRMLFDIGVQIIPVKGHMKNYVVFVQGENFNLVVDGKLQLAGFFASRRAEAETEEEAFAIVQRQLKSEPELKEGFLEGSVNSNMVAKVIHEMPIDHKNNYSGFNFYPMEEE